LEKFAEGLEKLVRELEKPAQNSGELLQMPENLA